MCSATNTRRRWASAATVGRASGFLSSITSARVRSGSDSVGGSGLLTTDAFPQSTARRPRGGFRRHHQHAEGHARGPHVGVIERRGRGSLAATVPDTGGVDFVRASAVCSDGVARSRGAPWRALRRQVALASRPRGYLHQTRDLEAMRKVARAADATGARRALAELRVAKLPLGRRRAPRTDPMQTQADVLGIDVSRPADVETTAMAPRGPRGSALDSGPKRRSSRATRRASNLGADDATFAPVVDAEGTREEVREMVRRRREKSQPRGKIDGRTTWYSRVHRSARQSPRKCASHAPPRWTISLERARPETFGTKHSCAHPGRRAGTCRGRSVWRRSSGRGSGTPARSACRTRRRCSIISSGTRCVRAM